MKPAHRFYHHGAEPGERQARYSGECDERSADGTERDRRSIREQTKRRCFERREANARQHRARNGDRRAESRGTFDERAECKCDQQRLQSRIARNAADGLLYDFKLSGFYCEAEKQNRSENNPADRK